MFHKCDSYSKPYLFLSSFNALYFQHILKITLYALYMGKNPLKIYLLRRGTSKMIALNMKFHLGQNFISISFLQKMEKDFLSF